MKRTHFFLPLLAAPLLGANAPAPTSITIDIVGLRNAKGLVHLCMSGSAKLFPEGCDKDPNKRIATAKASEAGTLVIRDVMPGRYAIVLLHDENSNKKMDKALFLPKEGFGFSRDAPVKMSAPKFEAAAFEVTGAPVRIKMKVRYL
ncbi:DUF2141 domain-containing protein [Novosphingobium sp.]|uniref:DUF2141 domain-containing protein n=1 Tax=Novosphingobium sp. TaxID=1874826 RepID=UPI0026042FE3|nr:DUF2141 domain-containing protein [Novosphingobium sp.]